jgi:hypothetical protein
MADRRTLRKISVLAVAAVALSGGLASGAADGDPAKTASLVAVSPPRPPIPPRTQQRLPAGEFYILGCPYDSYSCNVWEVSRPGQETELTHNPANFGIDAVTASGSGIIVADAATSSDVLERLTRHGAVPLPRDDGQAPALSTGGRLAYSIPPRGQSADFTVEVQSSYRSAPHTVLRFREGVVPADWGPRGQLAVQSIPVLQGQIRRLYVIAADGRVRELVPHVRVKAAVWNDHAPGIAILTTAGVAEVIGLPGGSVRIATGWEPLSWSPNGRELLIDNPKRSLLGLWSVATGKLAVIGSLPKTPVIGEVSWLKHPARIS